MILRAFHAAVSTMAEGHIPAPSASDSRRDLGKKDGGCSVVAGVTLRGLSAKASATASHDLDTTSAPVASVGTHRGCDAIVHATRR